jgi:hypothetical protein
MDIPSFNYFKVELSNKKNWGVAKANINFSGELLKKAEDQAEKKSKYTMPADQRGKYRNDNIKFQKQLMGTLAEIYVEQFLKEILRDFKLNQCWSIERYDDVRTDEFKSPENEYDIRIGHLEKDVNFLVESRSSICYDRSLVKGINQFDIIGPYTSDYKNFERANDIYIRPLYEYQDFKENSYHPLTFKESLKKGKINLYIVAGCSKKRLKEWGYDKNMGQGSTKYRVIKIINATDAMKSREKIGEMLESKSI